MRGRRNMILYRYLTRFDEILKEMSEKMLSPKISNNITVDFIECMIPHHQAAIYMCENLLQFTTYEPLIKICDNIIKTQKTGIEQMTDIARTTYGFVNPQISVNNYFEKYFAITKNMINRMRNSLRTCNINLNFTSEMIPHHEGAIEMCENLLQYYIDPRLRYVAESIITEQTNGVKELENIQKNLRRRY